jgi:hypothetical protein
MPEASVQFARSSTGRLALAVMAGSCHVGACLFGRRRGLVHGCSTIAKRARIAPNKPSQHQNSISLLMVFVMVDGIENGCRG